MLAHANDRVLQDRELQSARDTTMADIDSEQVEAYLQQRSTWSRQMSRFEDVERVLLGIKGAVVTSNGEMALTNAGSLFFGRDPQGKRYGVSRTNRHLMYQHRLC